MTVGTLGDITQIGHEFVEGGDKEKWFLLRSDVHYDSPECDRALEKRHLDEAHERNAGILDFGDLFDAMQSPHDRRKSQAGRDGQSDNYFNDLLDRHVERYAPYADLMLFTAEGNHEQAVVNHCGLNLTQEFTRRLAAEHGSPVHAGGYSGWVKFAFTIYGTQRVSYLLYYTHGAGGAAPVTRGVIKTNRRAVYLPDADLVVSGHTHHSWIVPVGRLRVSQQGRVSTREQIHVQLPSYKRPGAWEKSREFAPLPVHGAYWLRFFLRSNTLSFDVQRAV